ncbi:MAG TPA: hypothetical protein ENK18_10345 [Deltaproteobacteria bacterium]|nr:hypothetical protein [Deltaproteobacteria bacterium]
MGIVTMSAWLGTAWANSTALGGLLAAGLSPAEPDLRGPSYVAPALTLGGELWAIFGGETRTGRRGRTRTTPSNQRAGVVAVFSSHQGFEQRVGALEGGGGVGLGGQWGNHDVYGTIWSGIGVGTYQKTDGFESYRTYGPWLYPRMALGWIPADGLTLEVGPYASLILPAISQQQNGGTSGVYLGHVGLSLSILVGQGSPG